MIELRLRLGIYFCTDPKHGETETKKQDNSTNGRIFSVPPAAAQSLLSLFPSDEERAGVRGRARPCCQPVFPLSPSDGVAV